MTSNRTKPIIKVARITPQLLKGCSSAEDCQINARAGGNPLPGAYVVPFVELGPKVEAGLTTPSAG